MSSTTASFEVLPFRTEAQSEEVRRRMGGISARSPGAIGPGRGMYHGPYRPYRGLRRPAGGYDRFPVPAGVAPDYTQAPAGGPASSEQIRWVQSALNQIMNAGLPTDGIASPDFRAVLRNFQGQQGLPVSGFVGPDTIAALRRAAGSELEWEDMVQLPGGKRDIKIDMPSYTDLMQDVGGTAKWAVHFAGLTNAPGHKFEKIRRRNGTFKMAPPANTPQELGLYRFEFTQPGATTPGLYHGKAENGLFNRMTRYVNEINHLGQDLSGVVVKFLPLDPRYFTEKKLRALEILINDHCISRFPGCVNDQRELELPEIGTL